MRQIVPLGDMKVGQGGEILVIDALGSCLGLAVYDAVSRIGGLLHAMLPLSKINLQKAERNPFMFVDTGIPALFEALLEQGADKANMVVKAAGCGNPMGPKAVFKIGERNYRVMRKMLRKEGLSLAAEDIGGTTGRMVQFEISTGQTIISSNCTKRVL
jgi:chemotaxis protein CheD